MSHVVFGGMWKLRKGVTEEDFIACFNAYYEHLVKAEYALGYELFRREELPRFGSKLMPFDYWATLKVRDLAADEACLAYVASRTEPVHSLHMAMRSLTLPGSADFFRGTCLIER